MKHLFSLYTLMAMAAALCLTGPSFADGLDLATKNTKNFPTFSGNPASDDKSVIFDASDNQWKTVDGARLVPRVQFVSSTTAITCAEHGTGNFNYVSSTSANLTATLPAASGSGCVYRFVWLSSPTGSGDVIQVTGTDVVNGVFWMSQDSGDSAVAFETATDTDKMTFTSTTRGAAAPGAWVEFFDIRSGNYAISGSSLSGTGTEATPGATGQRP